MLANIFGFGNPVELAIIVVFFIPAIFWLVQLIDVCRRQFTGSEKVVWVLVILLIPLLGSILYSIIGRRQGALASA